jgi:mutator family transposase
LAGGNEAWSRGVIRSPPLGQADKIVNAHPIRSTPRSFGRSRPATVLIQLGLAGRPSIDRRTAVPARKVYSRRESSVEEALPGWDSVRRVEDITEALWGTRVSPSTVSNLNQKINAKIESWRNRPIEGEHPYLYLAATFRCWSPPPSIRKDFARSWGSARAPRRTNPAGRRFCAIWTPAA